MRRLPLFPLPSVLFPGAMLPLHLFEPRYRQMAAHSLEGDRRFGLIYHDPDRSGPFITEPGLVGCVAEISRFQPLPDGQSRVLVRGAERFRIVEAVESDALYFEAMVEPYEDLPEDDAERTQRVDNSRDLFQQVIDRLADDPKSVPGLSPDELPSFQIAQWIVIDATWQQDLLEMRREAERLDHIDALLRTILAEL